MLKRLTCKNARAYQQGNQEVLGLLPTGMASSAGNSDAGSASGVQKVASPVKETSAG